MSNTYLDRSQAMSAEIIANRRTMHGFAEVGMDLPKSQAFVMEKLREMGIEPIGVGGSGVTCTIGKKEGKTILLRGDMDALPMPEESGLDFAATNGSCHSCGHDAHTSMLLAAAKLLKDQEDTLNGKVKFMFQPGEEVLSGSLEMIANGILDGVDVALAMHIATGDEGSHCGLVKYSAGPATLSGATINIEVKGLAAHGSTPEVGVDAITIASHIVINLQEVLARELSCFNNCVLLVGAIKGGTTSNTVAGEALLECSARADTYENHAFLKQRVSEIASATAAMFRGTAVAKEVFGTVPVVTDVELSHELAGYAGDLLGAEKVEQIPPKCFGEDFGYVAKEVPSAFFHMCVGSKAEGHAFGLHHPKMTINEDGLPMGAAVYAHCAKTYLDNH